jgi:16S rRNA (cytosine967-C5)-methyltransferase
MTRLLAWQILRSGATAPTREVNRFAAEAGLDGRDRAFLRRLLYTEARRRGTLQQVARSFASGQPNSDLMAHLRLALAQILFMDGVPDRAAVSEQVGAVSDSLGLSKGRYVNAVLRSALRAKEPGLSGDPRRDIIGADVHFKEAVFSDPEKHPLLWFEDALSLPAKLAKGWVKRYGQEEAERLAREALLDPRVSLRVVRGTRAELQAELSAQEVETEAGQHESMLTAAPDKLDRILQSSAFQEGRITVQGEAAVRAAELCRAQPGERWLDLCAAPGGKTAVLAGAGAEVVACDVSELKVERLLDTCSRLGLEGKVTGVVLQDTDAPGGEFDGVLLDVPCSNTGVLARRPEARWRWGPKTRASLGAVQEHLLETGADHVKPGGTLVYSTCSLEPDENRQRVRSFLEAHPEWELEEEHEVLPRSSEPAGPVDGGYAARLRHKG